MGYTTDFEGRFNLDRPLAPEHKAYLEAFAGTRRMQRKSAVAAKLPDPIREAAGLDIGTDGGYFVGSSNETLKSLGVPFDSVWDGHGQRKDESIREYNSPPTGQPGLWCQWVPNQDGTAIEWDGGEKFYEYVEWLSYLIENFLKPWGYKLNGTVTWEGEDSSDKGKIIVKNNVVSTKRGRTVYR